MTISLVSFFNENLKGKKTNFEYYDLSNKYEISMIVDEYINE